MCVCQLLEKAFYKHTSCSVIYGSWKLFTCTSNHNFLPYSFCKLACKEKAVVPNIWILGLLTLNSCQMFYLTWKAYTHLSEIQILLAVQVTLLWFKCAMNISYCYYYLVALGFDFSQGRSYLCLWHLLPLVKPLFYQGKSLKFYFVF